MEEIPSAKSEAFSSADRIRQLNDIDKDVAKLVNSAGLAIQALANDNSSAASGSSIEERKAAFKTATSQYFALLSSIDVRLRRQVYALEEAGILDAESVAVTGSFRGDAAVGTAGSTAAGGSGTAAGVFNPLEISWLNSRKDTVGKDKEAESWATARELVKRLRDQNHDEEKMDTD